MNGIKQRLLPMPGLRGLFGLCAVLTSCGPPHREEAREPPRVASADSTPVAVPIEVDAIGAEEDSTCALLASGDVRCWGAGRPPTTPTSIGITDAVALAVGTRHACVARADGSVWCWGQNRDGQLGDGTTTDRATPLRVAGVDHIVELAAGGFYTCARDRAGAVWCWGGTTKTPQRVTLPAVRGLVGGEETTCATFDQAPPQCWGFNIDVFGAVPGPIATPTASTAFEHSTAFAIGARHACMVLQGAVYCAGEDQYGELGDQDVPDDASCASDEHAVTCRWTEYPAPPTPPLPGAPPRPPSAKLPAPQHRMKTFLPRHGYELAVRGVTVAIGGGHTCVIDRDTNVTCWGPRHRRPTPIANSHGAVALAVGASHACALLGDHSARCWDAGGTATPVSW
jgi:alpha-tubulin suppressor-like RCC1 family protein